MKKILVIGRKNAGEKNDAMALAAAIASQSTVLQVRGAYFEDIVVKSVIGGSSIYIHHEDTVSELTDYDEVLLINWSHKRLYTDLAHCVAWVAQHHNIGLWNKELTSARSSTKVSQIVRLSYEMVTIPETYFSLTPQLLTSYVESLGLPFIAKDPEASRGRANYLCQSVEEFAALPAITSYVVQRFIPNDKSDLRMFVTGGSVGLVILRRSTSDDHRNNVSQGATAELVDVTTLPEELITTTTNIANHFGRELCGIDFMRDTDTGEYIFLEINTTPQIVNGVFATEKAHAIAKALER